MTTLRVPLLTSLLALFLLQATPGVALAAGCSSGNQSHRLKVKVKDDQCVERVLKASDDADADEIEVCEGDTVSWSFSGPKKSIVFEGDHPFDWPGPDSGHQNGKIAGKVRDGAAKDGQKTSYKYSVTVQGQACVFDPKIIVVPR
jgi:hypothetical protein